MPLWHKIRPACLGTRAWVNDVATYNIYLTITLGELSTLLGDRKATNNKTPAISGRGLTDRVLPLAQRDYVCRLWALGRILNSELDGITLFQVTESLPADG